MDAVQGQIMYVIKAKADKKREQTIEKEGSDTEHTSFVNSCFKTTIHCRDVTLEPGVLDGHTFVSKGSKLDRPRQHSINVALPCGWDIGEIVATHLENAPKFGILQHLGQHSYPEIRKDIKTM